MYSLYSLEHDGLKLFTMRNIVIIFSFLAFLLVGCDECKDLNCLNGGVCEEGTCVCPTGYSGEECEEVDLCIVDDVECENGGKCVDGECECTEWYTREDCSEKVLEQREGIYIGTYSCSYTYPYIFEFSIIEDSDDQMLIEDRSVYNINRTFEVSFSDDKSFIVGEQNVAGYNNEVLKVEGDGRFNASGELSMDLQFNNITTGTSTTTDCLFVEE